MCGGFVGFEDGNNFGGFPKVGDGVVSEGGVEDFRQDPNGYRPQVLEVTVGDTIGACGTGGSD